MSLEATSSLQRVISSAAGGDRDGFELLCRDVLPSLYRIVKRQCALVGFPADEHRDIAHDTILKVFEQAASRPDAPMTWGLLRTVARNLIVDAVRHRNARDEQPLPEDAPAAAAAPVLDPEGSEVMLLLQSMDVAESSLLRSIILDDRPIAVEAQRLGISRWATYKRYERALARLRRLMSLSCGPSGQER